MYVETMMKASLTIAAALFVSACVPGSANFASVSTGRVSELGELKSVEICGRTDGDVHRIYSVEYPILNSTITVQTFCYDKAVLDSSTNCPGIGNKFCQENWEGVTEGLTSDEVVSLIGSADTDVSALWRYEHRGLVFGTLKFDQSGNVNAYGQSLSNDLPMFTGPRLSNDTIEIELVEIPYEDVQ